MQLPVGQEARRRIGRLAKSASQRDYGGCDARYDGGL